MNFHLSSTSLNNNDSLISVKKKQFTSGKHLPTQVCFEVTSSDLKKIKERRERSQNLKLSSELVTDLRYYGLLQNPHSRESRLIFITYYVKQQQKIAAIKTIIYLRGKISQQISRNFLDHPQLLKELVTTHYWLTNQISDRISFEYNSKKSLLIGISSLIIILIIAPLLFYFVRINFLIELVIVLAILFLTIKIIELLVKRYLPSFILQQLLFGFFSKNIARRRLGFILLRYFG